MGRAGGGGRGGIVRRVRRHAGVALGGGKVRGGGEELAHRGLSKVPTLLHT